MTANVIQLINMTIRNCLKVLALFFVYQAIGSLISLVTITTKLPEGAPLFSGALYFSKFFYNVLILFGVSLLCWFNCWPTLRNYSDKSFATSSTEFVTFAIFVLGLYIGVGHFLLFIENLDGYVFWSYPIDTNSAPPAMQADRIKLLESYLSGAWHHGCMTLLGGLLLIACGPLGKKIASNKAV